jgi:hypothetical protein
MPACCISTGRGIYVERVDIYVLCLYLGYDCPGRRVEGLHHNKKSICISSYKKLYKFMISSSVEIELEKQSRFLYLVIDYR